MIVNVYMMQVRPNELNSLQSIFRSSVEDSQNLIIDTEDLKSTLSKVEGDEITAQLIKDMMDTIDSKVKYVWFYL